MLALAISPNRRYLAISETVQEKPAVTIYELSSIPCRKRKVLNNFDFQVQKFTSMAFSPDSKYLLTQTSPPDSNLVYWLWEKQKVMAIIKADSQNNPIYQVPPSMSALPTVKQSVPTSSALCHAAHFSHVVLKTELRDMWLLSRLRDGSPEPLGDLSNSSKAAKVAKRQTQLAPKFVICLFPSSPELLSRHGLDPAVLIRTYSPWF